MNSVYENLANQLSEELEPQKVVSPKRLLLVWFALSIGFWIAGFWIAGGLRRGWLEQMMATPLFTLELTLGLAASLLAGYTAFREAQPHLEIWHSQRWRWALAALLAALGLAAVGIAHPTLSTSMAEKHPHCVWEIIGMGVAPLLLGLFLMRPMAPVMPLRSGALLGLAAALPPAVVMHLACMYTPEHALQFHYLPALALCSAAAVVAKQLLSRWYRKS